MQYLGVAKRSAVFIPSCTPATDRATVARNITCISRERSRHCHGLSAHLYPPPAFRHSASGRCGFDLICGWRKRCHWGAPRRTRAGHVGGAREQRLPPWLRREKDGEVPAMKPCVTQPAHLSSLSSFACDPTATFYTQLTNKFPTYLSADAGDLPGISIVRENKSLRAGGEQVQPSNCLSDRFPGKELLCSLFLHPPIWSADSSSSVNQMTTSGSGQSCSASNDASWGEVSTYGD